MARRVQAEPREKTLAGPVTTVLEAFEVLTHPIGPPRRIAGDIGELVPIVVVRIREDQRVVRRAATEGSRARIPDALDWLVVVRGLDVLRILLLLVRIRVVAYEEIPSQRI